ncbi:serine/threonine-protein kinase [Ruminococcus sp. 5_1_39BFAA]|uniref:serine/threonine-protein kinase n=1 Tax=Ruminococcus sp. 5_1_39BFAA TaxID=457412 RepID=UPI003568C3FE
MDKELPVSVWPEWRIIEKIGEGSFGKVYKAQRTERGRSFYSAIKIITIPGSKSELNSVRSETGNDNSTREYFQNLVEECIQEVSTMEYFRGNSHIVSVEDFKVVEYLDEIGWDISIRMEYLTSFMDYCTGKELTEKEVIKLGCDLCRALIYCNQLNIVHRDIKPENIFISRFGDFKLGDFGIARELERSMSSMSKKGTYSYMAPEMYRGEKYDSSADIYSLGIVLYKLMNHNRLPFIPLEKQLITYRDKENALTRRISGEMMPLPAQASGAFAAIILKACAYRPEERYRMPEDFLHDLDDLQNGRLSGLEQETAQSRIVQKARMEQNAVMRQKAAPERRIRKIEPEQQPVQENVIRKPKTQENSKKTSPWTISVVVVAIAACIITAVYAKLILDEDRRAQNSETVVNVLEENDYSTAQIDEFSTAIQTIKDQATEIVDKLPDCEEVGTEGERLRYYDENGKLLKALIYPEMSDDGVYEEYYYWDERLFFAYIWTGDKKELYYYDKRGKMIRWIDQDGTVHDKETDSTEYTKRGEKYWKISLEQFE